MKDFSDNNPMSVTVSLSCASGTVTPASASVSESSPASFLVQNYIGNPTCTATESPIPSGYSSTGDCSAPVLAGQCTITNTLLPPGGGGTPNPVGGVVGLIYGGPTEGAQEEAPGDGSYLPLALLLAGLPVILAAGLWVGRKRAPE